MDSISQAALGATIGEAILGRKIGPKGAILGALVATIPDLDVFLIPIYSPLQRISIHRGYSHSILVSVILSILLVILFRQLKWTKSISSGRMWLFSWLTLITHLILDTFTSYGTQLFLPFTNHRAGLDSITIVDPVYTIPLLTGLLLSLTLYKEKWSRRRWANYAGLLISSFYLFFTLTNKAGINKIFKTELSMQAINYDRLLTVPVTAANYKWYAVAANDDSLFIGSYSRLSKNRIHFTSFPVNEYLLDSIDPELADHLKWFSKGFYTVAELDGTIRLYNLQCDMQGIRSTGDYIAPTAWYHEIRPYPDGSYELTTGMHESGRE